MVKKRLPRSVANTGSCRNKVHKVMHEYKTGSLKSGKGGKGGRVKSRQQAVAIALSQCRKLNK